MSKYTGIYHPPTKAFYILEILQTKPIDGIWYTVPNVAPPNPFSFNNLDHYDPYHNEKANSNQWRKLALIEGQNIEPDQVPQGVRTYLMNPDPDTPNLEKV